MRSSFRRLGAVLALTLMAFVSRPAPALTQQDQGFRLFACGVTCLYYAISGQCANRNNQQCAAWYSGCVEGCMFEM